MPNYDDDSHFKDMYNPEARRYCPNENPLVDFADRKWWINYHWSPTEGTYVYEPFKSIFDPKIIEVSNEGIRLQILPGDDPSVWRTSEVVLCDKLGYGDYLITARTDGNGHFADLDKNAVFGAFIYQYSEAPPDNGRNLHREIDFLEVLRSGGGNAQFTLQPYDFNPHPVSFFKVPEDVSVVTIINHWYIDPGFNRVSAFYCYRGDWSFETPPPATELLAKWFPAHIAGVKDLIPDHTGTSCERLHLNLWLMHGKGPSKPQSVIVSRFQFRPHKD